MEQFNPFNLTNKKILVTGASSGIGKGIAVACSKMGGEVFISGRNENRLHDTSTLMTREITHVIKADLSDMSDVDMLVSKLPELDGIVYCAGVRHLMPCRLIDVDLLEEMMNINFKNTVILQYKLLKAKKIAKKSSIIFISSRATESPAFGNAIYSASKGALEAYAKCLALELSNKGIRVNCIRPGFVETNLIKDGSFSEEDINNLAKRYPMKRLGVPEDIANLSIYLLSDASNWVTGANFDISGGGEGLLTM